MCLVDFKCRCKCDLLAFPVAAHYWHALPGVLAVVRYRDHQGHLQRIAQSGAGDCTSLVAQKLPGGSGPTVLYRLSLFVGALPVSVSGQPHGPIPAHAGL